MSNPIDDLARGIGSFLDDVFRVKSQQDFWESIQDPYSGLSIRGYDPAHNKANPDTSYSPRDLSYEEIINIAQKRGRGFQVVDIVPGQLITTGTNNFQCSIPQGILFNKIGYSGELGQATNINTTASVNNYDAFLTVPIPIAGTFLKIDRLPNPANNVWTKSQAGQNSLEGFAKNPYYTEPATPLPATGTSRNAYRDYVIIQFDDPDSPLIIARPGDSFKLPFTGVYITTLNTNRRFSVTIGYNSEIVEKESHNYDLHTSSCQNLLDGGTMRPEPFCFTRLDQTGEPALTTIAPGATESITLFTRAIPNNPFAPSTTGLNGIAVGWITELSGFFAQTNEANSIYATVTVFIYRAGAIYKQVATLLFAKTDSAAGSQGALSERTNLISPVRYELDYSKDDTLVVRTVLASSVASNCRFNWAVTGYTMGKQYKYGTTSILLYNIPGFLDGN